MPKTMLPIYKTPTAERKLIDIAKWSVKKWGKKVAREYMANLEKTINLVASGELPCQENPEFSTRYSYRLSKRHYIFFEFCDDKIIVATIFHTAMHIKERLQDESLSIRHEIGDL
jgi:plasmid stabilization system protein ParE